MKNRICVIMTLTLACAYQAWTVSHLHNDEERVRMRVMISDTERNAVDSKVDIHAFSDSFSLMIRYLPQQDSDGYVYGRIRKGDICDIYVKQGEIPYRNTVYQGMIYGVQRPIEEWPPNSNTLTLSTSNINEQFDLYGKSEDSEQLNLWHSNLSDPFYADKKAIEMVMENGFSFILKMGHGYKVWTLNQTESGENIRSLEYFTPFGSMTDDENVLYKEIAKTVPYLLESDMKIISELSSPEIDGVPLQRYSPGIPWSNSFRMLLKLDGEIYQLDLSNLFGWGNSYPIQNMGQFILQPIDDIPKHYPKLSIIEAHLRQMNLPPYVYYFKTKEEKRGYFNVNGFILPYK